jgi:hypothetical protein
VPGSGWRRRGTALRIVSSLLHLHTTLWERTVLDVSAPANEPENPYDALGETARREVDKARKDPRLERERAVVADFWDAMDEAERVRKLAIRGAEAIRESDPIWAMAELAASDIENDFPGLNAQGLIVMNSALDSMVDEFAPVMREILMKALVDQAFKKATEQVPDVAAGLDDEKRGVLHEAFLKSLADLQPKLDRLLGSGAERYEKRLRGVGLGTAEDRPIPADLDETLAELGAIRDVLIHRASRIDAKALGQAPSLAERYRDGQFVRLTREDYGGTRLQSAAMGRTWRCGRCAVGRTSPTTICPTLRRGATGTSSAHSRSHPRGRASIRQSTSPC